MALSQSVVWTTLPYGRIKLASGERGLRVSVFASPRLIPAAKKSLGAFPLFLDWPAAVAAMKFSLVFDGPGGAGGELIPLPGEDPLDSKLWQRLFDEDTFVRGHAFTDLKDEVIRSFPVADVLSYVQNLYGTTAAKHGTEFPSRDPASDSPLTSLVRDVGVLMTGIRRLNMDDKIDAELKRSKVFPAKQDFFPSQTTAAFYQAKRFYNRKQVDGANKYQERPVDGFVAPAVAEPEFDFHQALAAFADYPRLMRRLGLVLDFVWVEKVAAAATGSVRVQADWGPSRTPLPTNQFGWTAYALSGTDFRTRAKAGASSELTRGQIDLRLATDAAPNEQKSSYLIAQLDVDGSALKTLHTAGSLVRMTSDSLTNYRTPENSDLPALRSTGISLYKRDRAIATHAQLIRSADLQKAYATNVRADYFADDLLRGYRVDIWDDVSRAWHPLCLRNGDYSFSKRGKLQLALRDEGYVKGSSVSRGAPGAETDLYLHERIAAFNGWSLVASRPGKTLAADPSETAPIAPAETAETKFGLAVNFSPPAGTLPRLRFGRNYKMRVRIVDIAGNSVGFVEAGEVFASPGFHFTRFEPVPSPTLLPRARVTEGESLEHLVIRSDYDRTASAYAADSTVNAILGTVRERLQLKDEAAAGYAYLESNERHVAPPKTSQLEAEMHGRFDDYIGPGKDHAKGFRLAQREAGTFLSRTMVNLDNGNEEPIADLDLELVPPAGSEPTDLDRAGRNPGDELQKGEYALHKEKQLRVPYLPDPFAAAVAFVGLPGVAAGEPYIVPFDGEWPNVQPFRIRLVERPGVMSQCSEIFAGDGAPSWDAAERVLTIFQPKGVVSAVRYSSVLPKDGSEKNLGIWKWLEQRHALTDDLAKAILTGRHWMITPWRTMMLVHAVQHPLCPPTIKQWACTRSIGDTFARLRGMWYLSIKSTAKVNVQARWDEPLDDVMKPTWQTLHRSANVAELKMETTYADDLPVPAMSPFVRKDLGLLVHEFGDTKHRLITYRLKGTTRFREYFPVELTQQDAAITRTGPDFVLRVPSSARPTSPQPVYVLPTFRWEETALPNNGLSRTRKGNGLRVYLERPWWSSGDNERLGVVFRNGPVGNEDKPFMTQWGLDPAFASTPPAGIPKADSFPLATETLSSVSLTEKGDDKDLYSVAGHAVEFDPERKLWFADVVVQAGSSYFPFIRLAVARFQPYSIPDCHLSRVVMTDFVQLVPDRTLNVTWISATKVRVKIFGPAPTETFVSRVIASLTTVRSATETTAAAAPIADLVKNPATGAKTVELFKTNQLEFIKADKVGINPGIFTLPADPAEASSKPGLNEYSVSVERLPENESPDFGWVAIDGIVATKPPEPFSTPATTPVVGVATPTKRTAAAAAKTSAAAAFAEKVSATKSAAAGAMSVDKAKVIKVTDTIGGVSVGDLVAEQGPVFQLKPLWEGDIALPAATNNRPRRLVVREHEIYLKATASAFDFLPIARRLVYVDIVPLPGPAA